MPCLHGGRVTLLGGSPFREGKEIAPIHIWSVAPRASSTNKHYYQAMFIHGADATVFR